MRTRALSPSPAAAVPSAPSARFFRFARSVVSAPSFRFARSVVSAVSTRSVLSALAALAALAAPLLAGGCTLKSAPQRILMEDAGRWFTGIEERRFDLLALYDANAPPQGTPEYESWAAEVNGILDRYEAQKAQGQWAPDPTGYALIKAMKIGTNPGTFWGSPGREGTVDEPILIIQPSFAYDEIAEQQFAEGTKVFLQGFPVGKVHRVEIGGEQRDLDILDSLRIRIFMKRNPDHKGETNLDPRFKVVRAELVDGSAKHRVVKWVY